MSESNGLQVFSKIIYIQYVYYEKSRARSCYKEPKWDIDFHPNESEIYRMRRSLRLYLFARQSARLIDPCSLLLWLAISLDQK